MPLQPTVTRLPLRASRAAVGAPAAERRSLDSTTLTMLFRRRKDAQPPSLLGRWKMVETDASYELGSGVTMEFTSDGRLTYTIHQPDREQLILLSWRLDGSYIVTDQPSQPAVSRTRYEFVSPDRLA